MVIRPKIFFVAVSLLVGGCAFTENPTEHTNPLDRIYDSNDFRMELTGASTSGITAKITWADAYHKLEGQTTDANLKLNTTAQLLYKTGSPTTADTALVKSASSMSGINGYANVSTISALASSYAGTFSATSPQNKGTYVIQFNYKFTNKSGVETAGIFYSNFVVLE